MVSLAWACVHLWEVSQMSDSILMGLLLWLQISQLDATEAIRLQQWPPGQVWWLQAASSLVNLSLDYVSLVAFFAACSEASAGQASNICQVKLLTGKAPPRLPAPVKFPLKSFSSSSNCLFSCQRVRRVGTCLDTEPFAGAVLPIDSPNHQHMPNI